MQPIVIGSRREVCWDDFLIDTARTTAHRTLHHPREREVVIDHDQPWEGDYCDYHCIVHDDGLYRLYYLGLESQSRKPRHTGQLSSVTRKAPTA